MNPLAPHFLTLARYHQWATERLLEGVAEVSDANYRRNTGLFFGSIHGTLNHLLVGENLLWLVRFSQGTSPRVALDAEVEVDRHSLALRLREDVVSEPNQREANQQSAPAVESGLFLVPKVIE